MDSRTLEENELINLFLRKRDIEIRAILLEQRRKELEKEIIENETLLVRANTVSEMYKEQPIKIVVLQRNPNEEPLFWRIFPLFKRGKDNLYSANVWKKVKGRAYGISLFKELTNVCLPYSYTRESALVTAKEWVVTHSLPERESLFVEVNPNESKSQGSENIEKVNNKPHKSKVDSCPKIYRPSQEPNNINT